MNIKEQSKQIRNYLGLEHNILVLLAALLAIGMGEELWVRFLPKYLEILGASVVAIGAYGSFKRIVDTLYQYPGGWISDALGRKKALVLFNLIAVAGYIIYILAGSWEVVVVGTLLVLAWSSMSQPAIFALIGDTLGKTKRAMGFSVQSIWKRVPIVIAPAIGGYLMERFGIVKGMHIGLAISIVLAIGAIYLQWHYYKSPPKPKETQEVNPKDIWRVMPVSLRKLLLTDCIIRFGSNLATVYVILLVLNVHHLSPLQFGALTSLQMTVAILGYLPAAHFADRYGRQPFILATFAFFALFPLSLAILPTNLIFISFIIAGLREIGEPARKARIVDLSASEFRGRVVGLYYLIRGLATIPAPIIGGLLWQQGYTFPFIIAFVVMAFGLLLYAINPRMTPEIS